MFFSVTLWWSLLCAVAALNVVAWSLSAVALFRRQALMLAGAYALRRMQLLLSSVYVFGCAYRSAVPVYDIPRICMFDSWLSNVIIGRSVATVAELCFAVQCVLILREASRATGSKLCKTTSLTVVPLIALAEACSWYSVLTTSNIGHIAEEAIWGLSFALMVTSLGIASLQWTGRLRRGMQALCVIGTMYVVYMFLVDVPMYWSRWIADQESGRHYFSLAQGLLDASRRWIVSYRWKDWENEVLWKSLYFSVAVWLSILFAHAPLPEVRTVSGERKPSTAAIA